MFNEKEIKEKAAELQAAIEQRSGVSRATEEFYSAVNEAAREWHEEWGREAAREFLTAARDRRECPQCGAALLFEESGRSARTKKARAECTGCGKVAVASPASGEASAMSWGKQVSYMERWTRVKFSDAPEDPRFDPRYTMEELLS